MELPEWLLGSRAMHKNDLEKKTDDRKKLYSMGREIYVDAEIVQLEAIF